MWYSGGPAPPAVTYSFIDAANLWQVIREFGERYLGGPDVPIRWQALRAPSRKLFYYDAVPVQQNGEDDNTYQQRIAPKLAELSAIEKEPGFHVRTGDVRNRRRRGNEQKMVDVHLAVDALLMASRGLFSTVHLFTGDLDFKPLVTALVELGVDVNLRYPKGATNDELIAAADHASPLSDGDVAAWIDQSRRAFAPPWFNNVLPTSDLFNGQGISQSVTWVDERYGNCLVCRLDGDGWGIAVERSPDSPPHRLEGHGVNRQTLSTWVSHNYQINLPPPL